MTNGKGAPGQEGAPHKNIADAEAIGGPSGASTTGYAQALGAYLARGWALVPLHSVDDAGRCSCGSSDPEHDRRHGGKHPRYSNWQNTPVTSLERWTALTGGQRCNIGIVTGAPSGVFALDVDPDNGGEVTLKELERVYGDLPATWIQRTGSGGTHYVFSLPVDFMPTNSAGRLGEGLDIRGKGGQIVAAPSVSGKGAYVVTADVTAVPAPGWLLDLIRPAARPAPRAGQLVPAGDAAAGRLTKYAADCVKFKCDDIRAECSGRNTLAYGKAKDIIRLINAAWSGLDPEDTYQQWEDAVYAHPLGIHVPPGEVASLWRNATRDVGDEEAELPMDRYATDVIPLGALEVPAFTFAEPGEKAPAAVLPAPLMAPPETGRTLRIVRGSEITMRATRWLWEEPEAQWMPLGGLTLLGGREGIGKSTWAYRIAAQLTRGGLPGSFEGAPRSVVIAAGEDAWEQTIVPRLVAADADLDRVIRVDVVMSDGAMDGLSLPEDIAGLTGLCARERVSLLLLDPLMSAVSGRLDSHKDHEVRKALAPLSRLAGEAQIGILGLIHVNKSQGTDLLTRLMASRAFSAVARAVLFCQREESDDEEAAPSEERFLFGQAKSNLGRKVRYAYRYVIEGVTVGHDHDLNLPVYSSRIRVTEKIDGSIDDQVAAQERPKRAERTTKADAVKTWLIDHLGAFGAVDAESARPSRLVKEAAEAAGHAGATLRRVALAVACVAPMEGATTGWYLKQETSQMSQTN